MGIWLNLLVVLVLLIIGGLFTSTELALVSLRPGELDELRHRGRRGARVARLAGQPTRFLGAVQIGSIVAGFFAAAFATATLAEPLGDAMGRSGLGDDGGETLAVLIVTLATTFLALIVAELTPRRYAMQRPVPVASLLGPVLDRLAAVFRPVIWLLEKCSNGLLRVLGVNPRDSRAEMSVEEVRELVLAHEEVPEQEKGIIRQVFAAGDRTIRQAMIPRANIDFLTAEMTVELARHAAWEHTHTRYPVNDGDQGRVTGFLHVRDLFAPNLEPVRLIRTLVRPITAYPPNKKLLAVLGEMQSGAEQIAAVVDEYGAVMGMVTLEDVVEELVGEMYDEYDKVPGVDGSAAGSTVVEGLTSVSDFARRMGFELPPGRYDTVGGYLQAALDRTPQQGDAVQVAGHRLTVESVDGWRVGRVIVEPLAGPGPAD